MKKIIMPFMCLFILPVIADECPEIKEKNTLYEIVEIGLCRNPQTKMGYLSVESARMSKNSAYSNYLPYISANASMDANDSNNYKLTSSAGASATYLIFDFGKRYAELSKLASIWEATGFDYDQTVQNYVYEIIGAYYGLLFADADVETSKDLLKVATEAKATADMKFKAGIVAKVDTLRAETTLASKRTELQRSEGNHEIAVAKLLSLLSLPQGTKISIIDMPAKFGSSTELQNINALIETAEKNRPDLLAASANVEAARYGQNEAFSRHLPTISANGGFSYDIDTKTRNTQIGINISVPIFTGFANTYSDRIASLNYERAKESEQAKRDSIALDVWTTFQNYKTAREVLESTNSQLKSAKESERAVAGMYKVGRSTMLDWQNSQADLASARKQNVEAKYDLFVKRAALAMAIGELKLQSKPESRPSE